MQRFCSIFSQLLQLFPRMQFEQAVRDHKAEYHARGFSSWGQFVAMLFCQLGRAHTLREICGGLASCEGKLKHLGVPDAPKKSTLAYANEHCVFRTIVATRSGMIVATHSGAIVATHSGASLPPLNQSSL